MARKPAVAVIDIGKSNAKLVLVDEARRHVISTRTTSNAVVGQSSYPHYDVDRLWAWILDGLRNFAAAAEVTAISVTTHGACFVLLAGDEIALPVLDYEFAGPESVRESYGRIRGDFAATLSPDLPNGLNAGRQFYWQRQTYPDRFASVDAIVPYPQYWAWKLSGAKATEVTSLGCHTDLWNPRARGFSRMAISERWDRLFPPIVNAWDTVGTILPAVAESTGLSPSTRVVAGIHDSNASLLPHLLSRPQPFAVLSSGTWMVTFAPGGGLDGLDPDRDCLANVDAFGNAVPSSRFMAGREFALIAGGIAEPTREALAEAVATRTMALPTFAHGTGPYGGNTGRWMRDGAALDPSRVAPSTRSAVASLYAALVAETCLQLAGADGPVIVEGPFARNAMFLAALAQRVPRPVIAHPDVTGTTQGALLIAFGRPTLNASSDPPRVQPLDLDLSEYSAIWRSLA